MENEGRILHFSGLNLILILFWMGVIFSFSSIKGNTPISDPPLSFYIQRKGAHIGEYFIMMLLLINFLKTGFDEKLKVIFLSGLAALTYAVTDEVHQMFVFGREGKISDVGFDFIGITLAGAAVWFFYKIRKKD